MARSSANDPLEKFRFSLSWSNDANSESTALSRAGFHDVQLPKRSTTKITYREGIDPDISALSAGLSSMEDVTLSRGLLSYESTSESKEFYKWMSSVHNPQAAGVPLKTAVGTVGSGGEKYRKDVTISMYDRTGKVARAWQLVNAFPIQFTPGADLNASEDGDKSLESLTLAYEDFIELKIANGAIETTTSTPSGTSVPGDSGAEAS